MLYFFVNFNLKKPSKINNSLSKADSSSHIKRGRLTTACNSGSRGSNAFVWPLPRGTCKHVECVHTNAQHIHLKERRQEIQVAGKTAQQLRAFATLQRPWIQFPAPSLWLTAVTIVPGIQFPLLASLDSRHACGGHINMQTKRSYT